MYVLKLQEKNLGLKWKTVLLDCNNISQNCVFLRSAYDLPICVMCWTSLWAFGIRTIGKTMEWEKEDADC